MKKNEKLTLITKLSDKAKKDLRVLNDCYYMASALVDVEGEEKFEIANKLLSVLDDLIDKFDIERD